MEVKKTISKFKELRPTFRHLVPALLEIYSIPAKLILQRWKFNLKKKLVDLLTLLIALTVLAAFILGIAYLAEGTVRGITVGLFLCTPMALIVIAVYLTDKNYE